MSQYMGYELSSTDSEDEDNEAGGSADGDAGGAEVEEESCDPHCYIVKVTKSDPLFF